MNKMELARAGATIKDRVCAPYTKDAPYLVLRNDNDFVSRVCGSIEESRDCEFRIFYADDLVDSRDPGYQEAYSVGIYTAYGKSYVIVSECQHSLRRIRYMLSNGDWREDEDSRTVIRLESSDIDRDDVPGVEENNGGCWLLKAECWKLDQLLC